MRLTRVRRRPWGRLAVGALLLGTALPLAGALTAAGADDLAVAPVLERGLSLPTAVEITPDGKILVAEKEGRLKMFDGPFDTTPTVVADLRTRVDSQSDRGLLGLAIDPEWPAQPYAYVLYTRDAPPGMEPPVWNDECPDPPGINGDGCVVTGTLSRIAVSPSGVGGAEQRLIDGAWCQQFSSHSIADLSFGRDGALYVSAGEGAWYNNVDYGQWGGTGAGTPTPANPCGDPPGGTGTALTPPNTEGGALRAQDINTPGDPTGFSGAIIRVDKATGQALPDNPLFGGATPTDDAYVAYGLRNPFRINHRPGTDEVWIADVGWQRFEEINRLASPLTQVQNFGWPCYEGNARQPTWDGLNVAMCENLYDGVYSAPTPPARELPHSSPEQCGASVVLTGVEFYTPGPGARAYPDKYDGGLFWTDYAMGCVWFAPLGADGQPEFAATEVVLSNFGGVVDIERGPDGDLYLLNIFGRLDRLRAVGADQAPTVEVTPSATSGFGPLTVTFEATASDPDDDALTYSWDFDGDNGFGDAYGPSASYTFEQGGPHSARVRVSDGVLTSTAEVEIYVFEGRPPQAVIDTPIDGSTFRGDRDIQFAGRNVDPDVPYEDTSGLTWDLYQAQCSDDSCERTLLAQQEGVGEGTFAVGDYGLAVLPGQDATYLHIELTARDNSEGPSSTSRVVLQALTTDLTLSSQPAGIPLAVDGVETGAIRLVSGTGHEIGAPPTATIDGTSYAFSSWVGGGGSSARHLVAPVSAVSRATAIYTPVPVAVSATTAGDDEAYAVGLDPVQIFVGANDADPEGDLLTVEMTSAPPLGGAYYDETTGAIVYQSGSAAADADDSFEYLACDADRNCDVARVTVHLNSVPALTPDTAHLSSAADPRTAILDLLANDTDAAGLDIDGARLSVSASNGATSLTDGVLAYTHRGRFGTDAFKYVACGDRPAPVQLACAEGDVSIFVNDPPPVTDDYLGGPQGGTFTLPVLDNDTDVGGLDPATLTIVAPPTVGDAVADPETGTIRYTSTAIERTVDQLRYRVCDADPVQALCGEADAFIATNGAPTAADDVGSASIGLPATLSVLGNDSDPDEDYLYVSDIVTQGTLGHANSNGEAVHYTAFGPAGTDSVEYLVCDNPQYEGYDRSFNGASQCATATLTIEVTEPGTLRVETVPPVPTQISFNGTPLNRWGVEWVSVPSGPGQVCFSDVEGYMTPECADIVVDPGGTTTVTATFAQAGFLRVLTDPPRPGAIIVDGVARNSWGLWTEFAPGAHEVCFGPVGGLAVPPCQQVEVTGGATTTATGVYTEQPGQAGPPGVGFLQVDNSASPADLVVDGVVRDSRKLTLLPLAPGEHELCARGAVGFVLPGCTTVFVDDDDVIADGYLYTRRSGLLFASTEPRLDTVFTVDGVARHRGWLELELDPETGSQVCPSPVTGYSGPWPRCQGAYFDEGEDGPAPLTMVFNYFPEEEPPPEEPPPEEPPPD